MTEGFPQEKTVWLPRHRAWTVWDEELRPELMDSKVRFAGRESPQRRAGALGCRAEQQDPAEGLWAARGWGVEAFPGVGEGPSLPSEVGGQNSYTCCPFSA